MGNTEKIGRLLRLANKIRKSIQNVEGFDAFKSKVEELSKEGLPLFVHFSGSKENGVSWCPDCVVAEPIIESTLEKEAKEPNPRIIFTSGSAAWPSGKTPTAFSGPIP